ncbi:MAG: hypothetical protein COY58_07360 [Gammaproteobacteria bacterium CG_4_10_14_0_8_um_filter_38_16]|nr:MAG: hypothetical protein COY58_07360 [Gammaproteobacteria bacterium CG_4_10_14_0_8_um_filter_38_16]PJA02983.1 MAG: hypothetical protein COX72_07585 [Gammaproteobacteria bacterium CG_4_10_14_0_2_um_filter_38_22]PJB09449.1 MAG: hypothetical protein CO120_10040 [Gammaproteobacteria bacterium CG_4_9_14_3_um_filter_38_9]
MAIDLSAIDLDPEKLKLDLQEHRLTYYEVLGVEEKAGDTEIKKAYKKLALQFHPDKNPGDAAAETLFKIIGQGYAILMDPEKRSDYDGEIASKKIISSAAEPTDTPQPVSSLVETEEDLRELLEIVEKKLATPEIQAHYEKILRRADLGKLNLNHDDIERLQSFRRRSARKTDTAQPASPLIETEKDLRELLEIVEKKLATPEIQAHYETVLQRVDLGKLSLNHDDIERLMPFRRGDFKKMDFTSSKINFKEYTPEGKINFKQAKLAAHQIWGVLKNSYLSLEDKKVIVKQIDLSDMTLSTGMCEQLRTLGRTDFSGVRIQETSDTASPKTAGDHSTTKSSHRSSVSKPTSPVSPKSTAEQIKKGAPDSPVFGKRKTNPAETKNESSGPKKTK